MLSPTARIIGILLFGVASIAACGGNSAENTEQSAAGSAGTAPDAGGSAGHSTAGNAGVAGSGATGGHAAAGGQGGSGGTGGVAGQAGSGGTGGGTPTGAWSLGYYASWQPDQLPVSEIEWSGLTHIAMAFYTPGSMSLMGGGPQLATDLVAAAKVHGVKTIASIGGADSGPEFQAATLAMATLVASLVSLIDTVGYDGLDIDWEPFYAQDQAAAIELANQVRAARPGVLITMPIGYVNINIGEDLSGYPAIAAVYDQLNIMSYGMAGAWQGWKSWHSSPLYQQDSATPLSIDSTVQLYLAAGVPKSKLGFGIGFYGICYSPPVTAPDQDLNGATLLASDGTMSYANIMSSYYAIGARSWDLLARVPYLSFTSAHDPDGCTYISYDDEQSIAEKGAYLKAQGLGGVIQWQINEGYIASAPAGQRNPLLTAIRDSILH